MAFVLRALRRRGVHHGGVSRARVSSTANKLLAMHINGSTLLDGSLLRTLEDPANFGTADVSLLGDLVSEDAARRLASKVGGMMKRLHGRGRDTPPRAAPLDSVKSSIRSASLISCSIFSIRALRRDPSWKHFSNMCILPRYTSPRLRQDR
jgi:hypothetical protein